LKAEFEKSNVALASSQWSFIGWKRKATGRSPQFATCSEGRP
jgi:hypothetical protein